MKAFNNAWDQYADPDERRRGRIPRGDRPQGRLGRGEEGLQKGRRERRMEEKVSCSPKFHEDEKRRMR